MPAAKSGGDETSVGADEGFAVNFIIITSLGLSTTPLWRRTHSMALLTHSETLAFNGFLSSIDFGDSLEWSGINPDTIPLTPAQGKEALAKATKDLMSLEPNLHASDAEVQQQQPQHRPSPVEVNAHWPSFRSEQPPQHGYTYGFDVPSSSSSSSRLPHRPPSSHTRGERRPSPSQDLFSGPRSRSPRARGPSSASSSSLADQGPRPAPFAAASAPAVLNRSASSSKRGLPDGDWQGSSAGASSAKRRRPSDVAPPQQQQAQAQRTHGSPAPPVPRSTRASSVSSSTTTATGTGDGAAKPALLSPSQKRANHIQSEQKRRANIRKGYEALCEVVPALRDAIRAEEETGESEFALRACERQLLSPASPPHSTCGRRQAAAEEKV